jgi:hypothetical protein
MNMLERLKELNATTGKRKGDEDLGHWADREKRENMWVRDVALPALIAVAEAAKWVRETTNHAYVLNQAAVKGALDRLDAALAKLEGEA